MSAATALIGIPACADRCAGGRPGSPKHAAKRVMIPTCGTADTVSSRCTGMGHATAGRRNRIEEVTRHSSHPQSATRNGGRHKTPTPGTVVSECGAAVAR